MREKTLFFASRSSRVQLYIYCCGNKEETLCDGMLVMKKSVSSSSSSSSSSSPSSQSHITRTQEAISQSRHVLASQEQGEAKKTVAFFLLFFRSSLEEELNFGAI